MLGFFVAGLVFACSDVLLVVSQTGWPPTSEGYVHMLSRMTMRQLMTLIACKRLGQLMVLYTCLHFLLPTIAA